MSRSCSFWRLNILLRVTFCLPAVMMILRSVTGESKALTASRGSEATFECPFNTSGNDSLYAVLKRKTALCEFGINKNSSDLGQCNNSRIRKNADATKGIVNFTIHSLQINDSDSYICEVKRMKPAPVIILNSYKISLQVTASPEVSVSQVEGPSGVPMLLCSSKNFHPAPIEQVWLRNGLPLNTSHHRNITSNADGSFGLDTHLSLQSERTEDVLYSCWVNHSSLSTLITVDYNPTPDGAETNDFRDALMILTLVAVLLVVSLITFFLIFFQRQNIKKVLRCCTSGSVRTAGPDQELELISPAADDKIYSVLWDQQKNKVNVISQTPP